MDNEDEWFRLKSWCGQDIMSVWDEQMTPVFLTAQGAFVPGRGDLFSLNIIGLSCLNL